MPGELHEDLARHAVARGSSDRSFGLWFALIAAIVGLLPLRSRHPIRVWALIAAGIFLLCSLLAPRTLRPLNQIWTRIGELLGKVVNPIVMSVVFLIAVTPIAVLARIFGKDLLRLRTDAAADSYWIPRDPPGPEPASMARQF